ncbi:unnamed protein product (macronuclear) [Paramecium tetraurelia]|uniref:Uncharacterized protein n=1 Tax=Paramecium tetraurelia TaxID=5888 RepID=A0DXU6_PARTE|nr:uncharacterized protein GSPATT00021487001 [Paramecium tetraurelia]CAK87863.1 unnamed protein product [Paramecium tetraurelia]|eukprot:XP_001455260.1 hypothetical protein (macronuclear) [Paramecium tetraurelia strain d4-2]
MNITQQSEETHQSEEINQSEQINQSEEINQSKEINQSEEIQQSEETRQSEQEAFIKITKNVSQVGLDDEGTFKYILILLTGNNNQEFYFVRGLKKYGYHAQNFEHFCNEVKNNLKWSDFNFDLEEGKIKLQLDGHKFKFKCLGGGRIKHSFIGQSIEIYGYSWLYGQCDHKISLNAIRTVYPYLDSNVITRNDGY